MTKNEIKKAVAKRTALGFMIGVFIGQTILILESLGMRDGNFYPFTTGLYERAGTKIGAVIIQYFITGLVGSMFAGTSVIFELDDWSLLRQTVTHFIFTSILMYIAGFISGWFPHTVTSTIIWFVVFIVIYIIFWTSFTLYYKNKVKKINEAL